MNSPLVTSRISWSAISEEVFRKTGRVYSGSYLREIATGWRKHSKLMPLLEELGVVSEKSPLLAKAAAFICDKNSAEERLLRHRRILASHLRESIQSARSLRAELDESESRVAATALRLGEEIAAKVADIEVLREHVAAVTADRNALRAYLDESRSTIERLSKAVKARRTTHIRLGNELFRNRTKERV